MSLFGTVLQFFWGIYPEVELLDHGYLFIFEDLFLFGTSQVAPVVKNPLPMQETQKPYEFDPLSGNLLEEEMARHPVFMPEIPWAE